MASESSDATPNIGCTEPALPLPAPVVERLTISRDSLPSPPSSGDSQNPQVKPFGVAPMHLGGASSGDPQTILPTVLDYSPCSAPDSAPRAPDDIPDDAELFLTHHVTYADHRSPSGPTTFVSSPDASDKMDPPLVDSDTHFTPCEGLLYQNIRSQSYEAGTPSLSPTPGVLLQVTSLLAADTLARISSPSHLDSSSDDFMRLTPPLSSPPTESNLKITGDSARDKDAGCTLGDAKIDDYPAITMSSPNFPLHGNEFSFSSSPPYPTTGTKRARHDDSEEVRVRNGPVVII